MINTLITLSWTSPPLRIPCTFYPFAVETRKRFDFFQTCTV